MIQDDVEVLDWHDSLLDVLQGDVHFLRNVSPHFLDIIHLVDVEHA